MNKRFSRFVVSGLATALCVSAMTPAFAVGTNYGTTITGDKTYNFDKYLVMKADANVPNATFNFTITPGEAVRYNTATGVYEVKAGIGSPDIGTAVFGPADTAVTGANTMVKGLDDGEKYATKSVSIDFSGVPFTEPGVYRYKITESATDILGITNDVVSTRILDVYVDDATTGTEKQLTIAGYVLYESEADIKAGENFGPGMYEGAAGKDQGFTNDYSTYDLTIGKSVTGNQASQDKYFKFEVVISGAVAGTKYDVDITNADGTILANAATIYTGVANSSDTLVVQPDGTVSATFYLQHGQSVKIKGLAAGTKYTVTETPEDYKSSATFTGDEGTFANNVASDTVDGITADTTVNFLNTREGVIPTGVLLTVAPFVALMAVGGAGFVAVAKSKKKDDAE